MPQVQEQHTGPAWRDTDRHTAIRLLLAIRSSFLLFIVATGVFFVALASAPSPVGLGGTGVLAAMFAIWGLSAILYAVVGFVFLTVIGYR
jgi:hypothetical protein